MPLPLTPAPANVLHEWIQRARNNTIFPPLFVQYWQSRFFDYYTELRPSREYFGGWGVFMTRPLPDDPALGLDCRIGVRGHPQTRPPESTAC